MANFLKLTQSNGSDVLINPDHISSMYSSDNEDTNFSSFIWAARDTGMPYRIKETTEEIIRKNDEFYCVEDNVFSTGQPILNGEHA